MADHARHVGNHALLQQRIAHAGGGRAGAQAFLFLGLDHFIASTALLGRGGADLLRGTLEEVLEAHAGPEDLVVWLGTGKFGLLLDGADEAEARRRARGILHALQSRRVGTARRRAPISASVGIASTESDSEDLIESAALACSLAREEGLGRVVAASGGRRRKLRRHMAEIRRLAQLYEAMEGDALRLYAQRIVPLGGRGESRPQYEVLLRIPGVKGMEGPARFVEAAERYRMVPYLDQWVVAHPLTALGERPEPMRHRVSINVSGLTVSDPLFLRFLQQSFEQHEIPFEFACFEITETAAVYNWAAVCRFAAAVRRRGAHIKLDDFGTGLSSFTYLKRLQVDFVKIDGRFVHALLSSAEDRAIVEALQHVANAFGVQTVAEHVEDAPTIEALEDMGVQWAQGFALHAPEPWDEAFVVRPARDLAAGEGAEGV
ncbi:GGDEF domain-containing protein [Ectothiorhodospiraceae bacterium 2226]|nr:GGDEF domain-containing protein [Ectothiorhodospiraceae bacterium 2226]